MTSVEHTGRQRGPVTLHIDTQAADIQVVADASVSGSWIELSTNDHSGPAVQAIRSADFRDNGSELHLTLREGQHGGGVTIGGNNYGSISTGGGMTIINGVVMGGVSIGRITVRAILEPGSRLVAKTMSGDVVTKGVAAVSAQTMSGGIQVEGVTDDSRLKSMSGDIRVYGHRPGSAELDRLGGRMPRVSASTMSGDVSGEHVDLDASSMSGRVRRR